MTRGRPTRPTDAALLRQVRIEHAEARALAMRLVAIAREEVHGETLGVEAVLTRTLARFEREVRSAYRAET